MRTSKKLTVTNLTHLAFHLNAIIDSAEDFDLSYARSMEPQNSGACLTTWLTASLAGPTSTCSPPWTPKQLPPSKTPFAPPPLTRNPCPPKPLTKTHPVTHHVYLKSVPISVHLWFPWKIENRKSKIHTHPCSEFPSDRRVKASESE